MATSTHPSWTVGAPRRATTNAPPPIAPRPRSRWSWHVGRVAGIDLQVHASFVLLLGWIALVHWIEHHDALEALGGVLLIAAVFAIVVLHELGHALVARHYGIRTFDITLLPIGGVARLERMPDKPREELLVALAGPAVNVALALVLLVVVALVGTPLGPDELASAGGAFLTKLMWINVALAVFNMLPAFPMDGGRVFRALLAMRMSHMRATDYAARLGQTLAVGLGVIGLFFNPILLFVAVFVWIGARQEAAMEHARLALRGLTVNEAMVRHFRVLSPDETVRQAAEDILSDFQEDFPVVGVSSVVGVTTRADIVRALASGASDARIQDVMARTFAFTDVTEPLVAAVERLNQGPLAAMPVFERGVLVGLLTPQRVGELMMTRSA